MLTIYVFTGSTQTPSWDNRCEISRRLKEFYPGCNVLIHPMNRVRPVEVFNNGSFSVDMTENAAELVRDLL